MTDPFPTEGVPFYRGKRVTVTGATGLIGSYVVKLLKESGAWVRAIRHERLVNKFTSLADEVRARDLMVPEDAVLAVAGVDIVLSCAGITGGIGIVKLDPIGYVGPATVMAANTLHACVERVERIGYLSSTTVYAANEEPVREGPEVYTKEPYPLYWGIGWSKRFMEKLYRYYAEKTKLKTAVIRPSGAYGRFDNFNENSSHVIPGMVNRAIRTVSTLREVFDVWGDGGDTRDLIHAQDVAMGLLLATAADDPEPFNIASGQGVTTAELARVILTEAGAKARIAFDITKPTALRTRLVDITRARTVLGFEPKIDLASGIRDTIRWRLEDVR